MGFSTASLLRSPYKFSTISAKSLMTLIRKEYVPRGNSKASRGTGLHEGRGTPVIFRGPRVSFRGPPVIFRGPPVSFRGPPVSFRGPPVSRKFGQLHIRMSTHERRGDAFRATATKIPQT